MQELNERYRDLRSKYQLKLQEKNLKISEIKLQLQRHLFSVPSPITGLTLAQHQISQEDNKGRALVERNKYKQVKAVDLNSISTVIPEKSLGLSAVTNHGDLFQMVTGIVDQRFAEHSNDAIKNETNDGLTKKFKNKEKHRSNEYALNKKQRNDIKKLEKQSIGKPDLEILRKNRVPYQKSPHSPPAQDSEEAPTRMGNALFH